MAPPTSISIAGDIGSGKSSVARAVADLTGWPIVATGRIFRDLAARRGLTVLELNQLAENDRSIDDEVDGHLRALADRGDSAVIDSRMAWHFVPASFKVYLVVDPVVAVGRVHGAVREDERYASVEEAAADIRARERVEAERYRELYAVDVDDWRNYDLIIDTSSVPVSDVADLIVTALATEATRPQCFLDPRRLVMGDPAPTGIMDPAITIAVYDDALIVVAGHDRVMAARHGGEGLVECDLVAFDDGEVEGVPLAEFARRAIDST